MREVISGGKSRIEMVEAMCIWLDSFRIDFQWSNFRVTDKGSFFTKEGDPFPVSTDYVAVTTSERGEWRCESSAL
jgi:hypothetical protein